MKTRLILVLLIIIIFAFSINEIYAETFQSFENDNYLYLDISNDTAFIIMRIDGKTTTIQKDLKDYKNENFKINAFENKIFVIPVDDKIEIKIYNQENNQKTILTLQKLDTNTLYEKPIKEELTILEKFEDAQNQTGMKLVVPLDTSDFKKESIVEKIPRSQYIESDEKIKILNQFTDRIFYYQEFFFDVRIVNSAINGVGNDFWNDSGFVNDVEIISTIKNPYGDILNEFEGDTSENGLYSSPGILFPYNSILSGAYTFQVNATKYFDESQSFATDSITKEFFVFLPNNNKSKTECVNMIINGTCIKKDSEGEVKIQPQK